MAGKCKQTYDNFRPSKEIMWCVISSLRSQSSNQTGPSIDTELLSCLIMVRLHKRRCFSDIQRTTVIPLVFLRSVRRLLVAACVVPSAPIFVTLMKEAPRSSETSVLTRATWRNNQEDTILHSHRRENLKSYNRNSPSLGDPNDKCTTKTIYIN
jgi:hypothetical protein